MLRGLFVLAMLVANAAFSQQLAAAEKKYYDAATEAQRRGEYAVAIENYRKVLHTRENYVPAHLNLASAYVANGQPEKSLYHLRRAGALEPNNGQVWLQIAAVHSQAGRVKDAEQAFSRVPKQFHGTGTYFRVRATIKIARNDLEGALADLATAHKKAPEDPQTLFLLASVQLTLGKSKEAIALLEKAGQRNPKEPIVWQALAEAHLGTGNVEGATVALEKAHRAMPNNVEVAVMLSRLYEQANRPNDAITVLGKMIRTYPKNRLLRIEQGDVFVRQQRWAEAEQQYLVARELHPRNPEIENRLATVAAKLGKKGQAKEQFEAVLLVDPKNVAAYAGLEALYLGEQAHTPLIRLYRRWMQSVPNDPYPSRQICELYRQGKEEEAAIREYRRHIQAFPNDLQGRRAFALFAEAQGDLETALEQLRAIVRNDPKDQAAQVSIGEVLLKKGDVEEAVRHLRAVAAKDPKDPSPWLSLGAYYERTEQLDRARATYEESLRSHRTEIVLANLVRVSERMGDVDAALRYSWDLLSTSKDPSSDFAQIPSLLYRNGRKEEAKKLWAERMAAYPTDTTLRAGYGLFLFSDGDLDGAVVQFQEMKRLEPKNPYPRLKLAEIREQQKRMDEWLTEVRGILAVAPDELGAYALLERYYHARQDMMGYWNELVALAKKGSPEDVAVQRVADFAPTVAKETEALSLARARVDAAPLSKGAWLALAKAHANSGQWPEAIEAYARTCRMDPMNIAAIRSYCLLAEERGTPQQAIEAYRLYSENHPRDAWGLLKYANLLRENGKPLEALDVYRKVLDLFPDNDVANRAIKEIEAEIVKPKDSSG